MGLEIGFDLYEKEPFDADGTLVAAKGIDLHFVCGRTDSTIAWGELFRHEGDHEDTPVFQAGLQGRTRSWDDGSTRTYVACDFGEFRRRVMDAVESDLKACAKEKQAMLNLIAGLKRPYI